MPSPISKTRSSTRVVILGILVVLGCASGMPANDSPARGSGLVVFVTNDSFSDVRVYAIVGEGNRIRLGSVEALSQRALRLPFRELSSSSGVRLIAQPLAAGEAHTTSLIRPSLGDTIEWQLANRTEISRWHIRM